MPGSAVQPLRRRRWAEVERERELTGGTRRLQLGKLLASAELCMREARLKLTEGDEEMAYIFYYRASQLIVQGVKTAPDFAAAQKRNHPDVGRIHSMCLEAMEKANILEESLLKRFELLRLADEKEQEPSKSLSLPDPPSGPAQPSEHPVAAAKTDPRLISSKELNGLLRERKKLLVLDVRSQPQKVFRSEAVMSECSAPSVVAVDQSLLHRASLPSSIEPGLQAGSDRTLFKKRDSFDLIVIVSDVGQLEVNGSPEFCLQRALGVYGGRRGPPVRCLEGGFERLSGDYPALCQKRPDAPDLESSFRIPTADFSGINFPHPDSLYSPPPSPPPPQQPPPSAEAPPAKTHIGFPPPMAKPSQPLTPSPNVKPRVDRGLKPRIEPAEPPSSSTSLPPAPPAPQADDGHVEKLLNAAKKGADELEETWRRSRDLAKQEEEEEEEVKEPEVIRTLPPVAPSIPTVPSRELKPSTRGPATGAVNGARRETGGAGEPVAQAAAAQRRVARAAAAEPRVDRSLKPQRLQISEAELSAKEELHRGEWQRFYAEMLATEGSVRGRPFRPGAVGLRNLGNTCYLNAVLQCLSHTPELRHLLTSDSRALLQDINQKNPASARSKGLLPSRTAGLFMALWRSQPPVSVLNPRLYRMAVIQATGSFNDTRQHDAQECLLMLVDVLAEDLNRSAPRPHRSPSPDRSALPLEEQERAAWRRSLAFNDSLVDDVFTSHELSLTTCAHCRSVSASFAPVKILSLEIPSVGRHLAQCLEAYFGREEIPGSAAWHCGRCDAARPATKQLFVHRPPPVLIVHLKRFWGTAAKVTSDIAFPEELDLAPFLLRGGQGETRYQLFAIVLHSGRLESGHYTAAAALAEDGGSPRDWALFDDEDVQPIHSFRDLLSHGRQEKAYVLFYRRRQPLPHHRL